MINAIKKRKKKEKKKKKKKNLNEKKKLVPVADLFRTIIIAIIIAIIDMVTTIIFHFIAIANIILPM